MPLKAMNTGSIPTCPRAKGRDEHMELDIQNTDAVTFLSRQEPESVDCYLVSPPFDSIRKYAGFQFDFEQLQHAQALNEPHPAG